MRSILPSLGRDCWWALLLPVLLVTVVATGCSEDPTAPEDKPDPDPVPTSVVVEFANPLAAMAPESATDSRITVIVPGNAAAGPVSVRYARQPQIDSLSARTAAPGDTVEIYGSGFSDLTYSGTTGVGPDLEISRGVGDVWVFGGLGADSKLKLPYPSSETRYLLIPHATNASIPFSQENPYAISGEELSMISYTGSAAGAGSPVITGRERFERHLRDGFDEIAAAAGGARTLPGVRTKPGPARAPAQFRQFNVLNTAHPDADLTKAGSYSQVTAELRYDGQHCLIYADVDTLASGNLTQADFDAFGERFDRPATGIHAVNTTYFGTESDIDGNGKVIMLVSGIINGLPDTDPDWKYLPPELKYVIAGFFLPVDLFRPGQYGIESGTTNEAEIFYLLAADPDTTYLDGVPFSYSYVVNENPITIAHEYQHLISYSYRKRNYGALLYSQRTWLEEGMAHMAEDLNGMQESNFGRAGIYLDDPGAVSLENDFAPLNQRGGIFLFLRYLGDRFDESIYKQILQSRCLGRPCIESITGENFYVTVADFLATLYLTGRGITADDKYNFRSTNIADFDSLLVAERAVGDGSVSGTIRLSSGDYYLFTSTSATAASFTFLQDTPAGLRTVVVKTR